VLIRRFKHKRQFKDLFIRAGAGFFFSGALSQKLRNGGLWLPKGGKGKGGGGNERGVFGETKEFGGS